MQVSQTLVQGCEGPVNGGGKYDPLKVNTIALVKSGYMLGILRIPLYDDLFLNGSRKNEMGAENQQERLDASWIVGFTDGEGCFHISINRIPEMSLGWQVLPEFRIVQHEKDEDVLYKIRNYFGFGDVKVNNTDDNATRKGFRVRGLGNLNRIVSFFEEHPLQTSKRKNFEIFAEVIRLMNDKEHLTKEGLDKIAKLVSGMNRKPRLKYLESSETIRRTP